MGAKTTHALEIPHSFAGKRTICSLEQTESNNEHWKGGKKLKTGLHPPETSGATNSVVPVPSRVTSVYLVLIWLFLFSFFPFLFLFVFLFLFGSRGTFREETESASEYVEHSKVNISFVLES